MSEQSSDYSIYIDAICELEYEKKVVFPKRIIEILANSPKNANSGHYNIGTDIDGFQQHYIMNSDIEKVRLGELSKKEYYIKYMSLPIKVDIIENSIKYNGISIYMTIPPKKFDVIENGEYWLWIYGHENQGIESYALLYKNADSLPERYIIQDDQIAPDKHHDLFGRSLRYKTNITTLSNYF